MSMWRWWRQWHGLRRRGCSFAVANVVRSFLTTSPIPSPTSAKTTILTGQNGWFVVAAMVVVVVVVIIITYGGSRGRGSAATAAVDAIAVVTAAATADGDDVSRRRRYNCRWFFLLAGQWRRRLCGKPAVRRSGRLLQIGHRLVVLVVVVMQNASEQPDSTQHDHRHHHQYHHRSNCKQPIDIK